MKKILSLILTITVLACGMIHAAAQAPAVTIEGIAHGQTVAYGEEIAIEMSATGDFTNIYIYLNGEVIYSTTSGAQRWVLSDVPAGRNVVKAVAEDENGNLYEGEKIEFYNLLSDDMVYAYDDFDDETSSGWTLPSDGALVIEPAFDGEGYVLAGHPGDSRVGSWPAKPELKSSVFSTLPANGFSFEFDTMRKMWHNTSPVVYAKLYMQTKSEANISLGGVRREGYTAYTPSITLGNSGESYKTMTDATWYHVKYEINLEKGTAELFWAEGKGNTNGMTSLGVRKFASTDEVRRLHFEFNGYGAQDPLLALDNMSFKQSRTSAYMKEPIYHMGGETFTDFIPPNPDKITVPFSESMNKATITKDAFTMYANGKAVGIQSVAYDDESNSAVIIFDKPLDSGAFCKLVADKSVTTSVGVSQPTDLVLGFNTCLNEFDIVKAGVKKDGIAIESDDIAPGDTISFEYVLQNQGMDEQNGVLIFVAYENDTLAYLDMQQVSVAPGTGKAVFTSNSAYTCGARPDSLEIYLWKSMSERTSLIQSRILN